jgi:hypothetical protein
MAIEHEDSLMKRLTFAREKAAQVWCRPETSHKVMDVELAEAFAQTLTAELAELREQFRQRDEMLAAEKSKPLQFNDAIPAMKEAYREGVKDGAATVNEMLADAKVIYFQNDETFGDTNLIQTVGGWFWTYDVETVYSSAVEAYAAIKESEK